MQKFLQNENFYKILVYLISNPPDNTIPSLKANHSMLCFKINYSPVAQSVERAAVNRYVVGSSPTGGAFWTAMRTKLSRVNTCGAVLQFGDGSVCRFRAWISVVWLIAVAKIEATIRPNFGKEPHGVSAGLAALVDRTQFDHLDVVLENLHLLFGPCRFQQLANILPGVQECSRILTYPLHWLLQLADFGKALFELILFRLQTLQFRLDTGKPLRPERLQHFDQL